MFAYMNIGVCILTVAFIRTPRTLPKPEKVIDDQHQLKETYTAKTNEGFVE